LTFVQKWLAVGRPQSDVILGGYEEWVKVVGGILKAVGIDGFLENANELYEQLDADRRAWVEFFDVWAEKFGAYDEISNSWGVYVETDSGTQDWEKRDNGEPVGTKELFLLASHFDDNPNEGLGILDAYLGTGKERARKISLGKQLQKHKGRIFGGYRLDILSTKRHQATVYRLTKVGGGMWEISIPLKESSDTADSEDRGECGELKSTPCSPPVKTYHTKDLLSGDHFNGPGHGAGINSPHSPEAFDDAQDNSRGVDLREGECPKSTFPQNSKDEDIKSEEREVFII
jgi:hypothetical protein